MEKEREGFYSLDKKKVLHKLKCKESGLEEPEAKDRLKKYGLNQLSQKATHNYLFALLRQFRSFFIYILLVAAGISYYVGSYIDVYVILAVIVINVAIGFLQEQKAEKSINALKRLVVSYAKVYRGGELVRVNSKELVQGDVILLEEGDRIPADCRLIEVKNFKTIESSLTGESLPVEKDLRLYKKGTSLGDRKNMVYSGTFVASGTAKAIVVHTGNSTEIGKIAESLSGIKRQKSHFQAKVDRLALKMSVIAFSGAIVTFIVGFFIRKIEFAQMFLFTISSLVSAIPEGLPAVLSIVLAVGALRMSKRNAIIRNLHSTETLGVVNTIITDKTGTLTQNKMTVTKVYLPYQELIEVSGNGYEPKGDFNQEGKKISPLVNSQLSKLMEISSLTTNSRIIQEGEGKDVDYSFVGDPTEVALVVLAEKAGLKKETLEHHFKKIDEMPFNQDLKLRANISSLADNPSKKELYVIGAPESVLGRCSGFLKNNRRLLMTAKDKKEIEKKIEKMASEALRVIAIAYRAENKNEISEKNIDDLVFIGFVGMMDPPRENVKEAIEKARGAGIRVIMATGDHKSTAVAIADQIGLVNECCKGRCIDQKELEKLSEGEFRTAVREINIFARLTPSMKLRIAETLQKDGLIVAMTGDGVNDAPALKRADIGISMGVIGTDVARESSEMILADDNFSSIVNAVEEGRIVFNNTRRTSFFLVTTNLAEQVTIISTLLLGLPLPLIPTQILWLNLVTDTGAGIGLATEPGHKETLNRKPLNAKEDILNKEVIPFAILMCSIMVILTILVFNNFLSVSIEKARTGAFVVMALTQLYNAFNMRSLQKSVFRIKLLSNKTLVGATIVSLLLILGIIYIGFFQRVFQFTPLSIGEFIFLFVISGSTLLAGEVYKLIRYKKRK